MGNEEERYIGEEPWFDLVFLRIFFFTKKKVFHSPKKVFHSPNAYLVYIYTKGNTR